MLAHSDLDSARFGIPIARATLATPDDVDAMVDSARQQGTAMVIVRVPAEKSTVVQRIERHGGRLCDTLVHHARSLEQALPDVSPKVRPAKSGDIDAIGSIAAAAFAGYGGHYHTDPRLDRHAADAGYVDWARRSLGRERVIVIEDDGVVTGFLAMRHDSGETDIVLNAVHPDHQRGGLYSALVAASLTASRNAGSRRCTVSTQVWNVAVQKVWVRLGFEPTHAVHTFHLWLDEVP
jgi:GNAT superfamily N-acetyltransferase